MKPRRGRCPWCGSSMEVGDEDPVLERCCEVCATKTSAHLEQLNPKFAKVYRTARRRLMGSNARE